MRISDWSSDVCSSDLTNVHGHRIVGANHRELVEGNYIYGFSHYPAHTLSLPTRTFTISLLRDPVSRIISHYNMTLDYVSRGIKRPWVRSEAHTSELQSLMRNSYAVFCLTTQKNETKHTAIKSPNTHYYHKPNYTTIM